MLEQDVGVSELFAYSQISLSAGANLNEFYRISLFKEKLKKVANILY